MLTPPRELLTLARSPLYIRAMAAEQTNHRFDVELKRLEKRLEELVVVCRQLQEENKSLRQRQDSLTSERASLLHKNEQVRGRVEAMIGRLKGMEQVS
jgi:cell division protein ZapB